MPGHALRSVCEITPLPVHTLWPRPIPVVINTESFKKDKNLIMPVILLLDYIFSKFDCLPLRSTANKGLIKNLHRAESLLIPVVMGDVCPFIHPTISINYVIDYFLIHCVIVVSHCIFSCCHNSPFDDINVLLSRLRVFRVTDSCQQIQLALRSGRQRKGERARESTGRATVNQNMHICVNFMFISLYSFYVYSVLQSRNVERSVKWCLKHTQCIRHSGVTGED